MSGVKRMAVRRVLHTHRPHKACNAGLGTPRKRASVQAAAWETWRYDLLRTGYAGYATPHSYRWPATTHS